MIVVMMVVVVVVVVIVVAVIGMMPLRLELRDHHHGLLLVLLQLLLLLSRRLIQFALLLFLLHGELDEFEFLLHALFLLVQFFREQGIFDAQLLALLLQFEAALLFGRQFLVFLQEHPVLHLLEALHLLVERRVGKRGCIGTSCACCC